MKKVMYSVPLNKLYKIMASCQFNEDALYCPVLVEIVDETIQKVNDYRRYLVQVWTKKGDMIFEKPLNLPICNWNISGDKFIFQEESNKAEIYLVKLSLDKPSYLFKFKMASHVIKNRVNTYYNKATQQFVVPQEKMMPRRSESSQDQKMTVNIAFQEDL